MAAPSLSRDSGPVRGDESTDVGFGHSGASASLSASAVVAAAAAAARLPASAADKVFPAGASLVRPLAAPPLPVSWQMSGQNAKAASNALSARTQPSQPDAFLDRMIECYLSGKAPPSMESLPREADISVHADDITKGRARAAERGAERRGPGWALDPHRGLYALSGCKRKATEDISDCSRPLWALRLPPAAFPAGTAPRRALDAQALPPLPSSPVAPAASGDAVRDGGTVASEGAEALRKDEVTESAVAKEDAETVAASSADGAEFWRRQIEAIYRRRNPGKMESLPELFAKHDGKEVILYRKVCRRYNLDAQKFYADDPKAWDGQGQESPKDGGLGGRSQDFCPFGPPPILKEPPQKSPFGNGLGLLSSNKGSDTLSLDLDASVETSKDAGTESASNAAPPPILKEPPQKSPFGNGLGLLTGSKGSDTLSLDLDASGETSKDGGTESAADAAPLPILKGPPQKSPFGNGLGLLSGSKGSDTLSLDIDPSGATPNANGTESAANAPAETMTSAQVRKRPAPLDKVGAAAETEPSIERRVSQRVTSPTKTDRPTVGDSVIAVNSFITKSSSSRVFVAASSASAESSTRLFATGSGSGSGLPSSPQNNDNRLEISNMASGSGVFGDLVGDTSSGSSKRLSNASFNQSGGLFGSGSGTNGGFGANSFSGLPSSASGTSRVSSGSLTDSCDKRFGIDSGINSSLFGVGSGSGGSNSIISLFGASGSNITPSDSSGTARSPLESSSSRGSSGLFVANSNADGPSGAGSRSEFFGMSSGASSSSSDSASNSFSSGTSNSLFGANFATGGLFSSSSKGLFSFSSKASDGLFGSSSGSSATSSSGSGTAVFGFGHDTSGGSLFGSSTISSSSSGTGVCGPGNGTSGGSLFGSSATSSSSSGTGVFGLGSGSSGGTLFGVSSGSSATSSSGSGTAVFSFGSDTSGGSLFGSSTISSSGSGTGVFGPGNGTSGGSLFGGSATSSSGSGTRVFGVDSDSSGGSLFGTSSGSSATSSSGSGTAVFGFGSDTSAGSFFGSSTISSSSSGTGVFGSGSGTSGGSLFGSLFDSSTTSGGSLFGSSATFSSGSGTGVFGLDSLDSGNSGGSLFGNSATSSSGSASGLFGLGSGSSGCSLFGASSSSSATSSSSSGTGIFGLGSGTSGGSPFGSSATSNSGSGRGVSGLGSDSSGSGLFGLFGTTSGSAGMGTSGSNGPFSLGCSSSGGGNDVFQNKV